MLLTDKLVADFRERGGLCDEDLASARSEAGQNAFDFAVCLIRQGMMSRDEVGMVMGDSLGCAYMNLEKTLFQQDIVKMLPHRDAERLEAIPIYKLGEAITLATVHPEDIMASNEIRDRLGEVDILFTLPDELAAAISVQYESRSHVDGLFKGLDFSVLEKMEEGVRSDQQSVVHASDALIMLALKEGVSDIHIEPKANRCVVRFRVDGALAERMVLDINISHTLISRYKVLAQMDISERRKPQDGRINFKTPIKQIDIRVNTLPTIHGETMVMRLLGSLFGGVELNLDEMGISAQVLDRFKAALKRPNGLVLVTGPTGSGKSTTLYAGLNYIDKPDIKIMTIEDPVEYEMPNFTQSQVNVKVGRTFESVLRAALRQDPDVLLIGETRDAETARIAAEAALTGHLVMSTLHTNNALQALTRLLDMGVESYVIAPALAGVLAQRLPRKICEHCKAAYQSTEDELKLYFHWAEDVNLPTLYRGKGCEKCDGSGYKGRIGIHEFVEIDLGLRELIIQNAGYAELRDYAFGHGYREMRYDGFIKVLQGLTTIEEVVRVTSTD